MHVPFNAFLSATGCHSAGGPRNVAMAKDERRVRLTRPFEELTELYDAAATVVDGKRNLDGVVGVIDELVEVVYFAGRVLGVDGDARLATAVVAAAVAKWESRTNHEKNKLRERQSSRNSPLRILLSQRVASTQLGRKAFP